MNIFYLQSRYPVRVSKEGHQRHLRRNLFRPRFAARSRDQHRLILCGHGYFRCR